MRLLYVQLNGLDINNRLRGIEGSISGIWGLKSQKRAIFRGGGREKLPKNIGEINENAVKLMVFPKIIDRLI